MLTQLKSFMIKCARVWHILKKPSRKEFDTVAKVSAIGILLIGIFGFIIGLIMTLFI